MHWRTVRETPQVVVPSAQVGELKLGCFKLCQWGCRGAGGCRQRSWSHCRCAGAFHGGWARQGRSNVEGLRCGSVPHGATISTRRFNVHCFANGHHFHWDKPTKLFVVSAGDGQRSACVRRRVRASIMGLHLRAPTNTATIRAWGRLNSLAMAIVTVVLRLDCCEVRARTREWRG